MASSTSDSEEPDWVPVVRKWRKKQKVPSYVLLRFPHDHPIHHANLSSEFHSSNAESDDDTSSPQDVIASRTQSKSKMKLHVDRP